MKHLLIVYHSRSGHTRQMADAVVTGARQVDGIHIVVRDAQTASVADVRAADGILLGTPENFGYMSGAIKMFFENIYDECLDHTQGLPYALFIRAGNDGNGALTSVRRIVTGLRWREIADPLVIAGEFDAARLAECEELGMAMAAGIEAGVF